MPELIMFFVAVHSLPLAVYSFGRRAVLLAAGCAGFTKAPPEARRRR